jgi:vacuolar-type H+-ATPase subunit H
VKVLTHRPRFIEPATVPEFGGETSSATEADKPTLTQKIEELATMPKINKIEEPRVEETKISEVLSPSAEVTVPKAQKDLIATPKRKRMVNVLDVLETIKSSSSTPGKTVEASKTQAETKLTEAEAAKSQARTEAGPSKPAKEKSLETGEKETEKEAAKQILPERTVTSTPEAYSKVPDYIVRHASGKKVI